MRDLLLGRHFLFGGRFLYGAVGWSTATSAGEVTNRILDPSAPGVFIHGGAPLAGEDGRTDDEIVVDFARALGRDPVAGRLLARVDRRYLAGWSDSSETVKRISLRARRWRVRARPPDHDGPTVRSPRRACCTPVSRQGHNARFRVRVVLREGRGGSRQPRAVPVVFRAWLAARARPPLPPFLERDNAS